jgi:hypothetical protein
VSTRYWRQKSCDLDSGLGLRASIAHEPFSAFFAERFLNLADRGIAAGPQHLHDPQLKLRQFGFAHLVTYYLRVSRYYYNSSGATVFSV